MKKFLLSFLLLLCTFGDMFAQRDTEHWFAPMRMRSSSNLTSNRQAVFLSTDSTTPFLVTIYSNNVVLATATISKGNPQQVTIAPERMVAITDAQCFSTSDKGLYITGEKPFFATYRFSSPSHGEILTSKGKAGIGKKFYAVVAPHTANSTSTSLYNFTCAILATEDNTIVTVSNYGTGVVFSNGTTGANNPSMTITLNKGQSYIIEGNGNSRGNDSGFIGAKIESNKNISVTNGNFNGQFALTTPGSSGSDIVMDQSVPVERLGDEFVVVKGMGNISEEMEGALIVATENDTQVFINGVVPAVATLNEGQWYRVNSTSFVNQGGNHHNLHIRTTKNVYVYQLLAGVNNSDATIGFNYIPPLNCFLPRKIDEIGLINILPYYQTLSPTVRFNILTEAGATVTVNNVTPNATQGPFPVTGTTGWVSYSLENMTGNVTVTSTKAVTAGIAAGNGVVGYGGYFAGFSSIPVIAKKSGDCVPNLILEVDDSYDTYQWLLNGVPIPGATTNTYTPTTGGMYSCTITMNGCPAAVTTPEYPAYTCLFTSTDTYNTCGTLVITPEFTSSAQTVVPSSVQITTQPANGTVSVDPTTGVITYIINPGFSGTDTFVYKFCGDNTLFTDCEEVTVTVVFEPLVLTDQTLNACNVNGAGTYDLTQASLTTTVGTTYQYYTSLADLQNGVNPINNPNSYTVAAPQTIYVKATTPLGCVENGHIYLEYYPSPVVFDDALVTCFLPNNETNGEFDLTSVNITSTANVTYAYYTTLANAQSNISPITDPEHYIAPNGSVYVRVISDKGCVSIAKITLTVTPPKRSPLLKDEIICVENTTTLDAGPGYVSYLWSTGATTSSITNVTVGSYWVDLEFDGCITRQTIEVTKSTNPVISHFEISNNNVTVTAVGGTPPYRYSLDNVTWQDSNVFNGVPRGQNTFYVKDNYNCEPVYAETTVPNLINVITPNGDNINDELDYSALSYKDNLNFSIYDRYGNLIYKGDKNNGYKWDGRFADKKVHTGTYWYQINWNEKGLTTPVNYTGWILVKNRD